MLFRILGVYLGVEFQTHPIMNIKRNIIFALESRKKDGVPIVENDPSVCVSYMQANASSLQQAIGLM